MLFSEEQQCLKYCYLVSANACLICFGLFVDKNKLDNEMWDRRWRHNSQWSPDSDLLDKGYFCENKSCTDVSIIYVVVTGQYSEAYDWCM